jgi:hypothetical protein
MEAIPSRPYRFTFAPHHIGPGRIDGGNFFQALLVLFLSPTSVGPGKINAGISFQALQVFSWSNCFKSSPFQGENLKFNVFSFDKEVNLLCLLM